MTTPSDPRPLAAPSVRRLVDLACRAPSIANSQPWRWRADGDLLELYADRSRGLPADDPTGRQLMISCGAALHHLQVAATASGCRPRVERVVPDHDHLASDDLTLLARIDLGGPATHGPEVAGALRKLQARQTDRSRFTMWPVPAERVEILARAARAWGDHATPVVDAVQKAHLSVIISDAARRHAQQPGVWTPPGDAVGSELDLEPTDGVVVLLGDHDRAESWVAAGEALSALWLEAAHHGLGVVPLYAPVETAGSREQLRQCLGGGAGLPLLVVRISWAAMGSGHLVRTVRRDLDDVLEQVPPELSVRRLGGDQGPPAAGAPDSPDDAATGT